MADCPRADCPRADCPGLAAGTVGLLDLRRAAKGTVGLAGNWEDGVAAAAGWYVAAAFAASRRSSWISLLFARWSLTLPVDTDTGRCLQVPADG